MFGLQNRFFTIALDRMDIENFYVDEFNFTGSVYHLNRTNKAMNLTVDIKGDVEEDFCVSYLQSIKL